MQALDLTQNYFELFGLDIDFRIDEARLRAKQQALQAKYHPDRFAGAGEREKRLSVQQAAWINEAAQTLLNPVQRARYMLAIKGLDIRDEAETTSDAQFLMEQLTLREQLDGCSDDNDPVDCCERIAVSLKQRAQTLADEFVDAFNRGQLEAARLVSRKMQFIHRIQAQVLERQFELEDELG